MERFILRETKPKRKRSKRAPGVRRGPRARKKTNERSRTPSHLVSPRSRWRSPLAPPAKAFECRLVFPNPSSFGLLLLKISLSLSRSLPVSLSLLFSSLLFILRAKVRFLFFLCRVKRFPDERIFQSTLYDESFFSVWGEKMTKNFAFFFSLNAQ